MATSARKEKPKVPLGRVVATPGALAALVESDQTIMEFLRRHQSGDWGEIHPQDRGINDKALERGERLLSIYRTKRGRKIWIITEADRSVTTLLLPSEY